MHWRYCSLALIHPFTFSCSRDSTRACELAAVDLKASLRSSRNEWLCSTYLKCENYQKLQRLNASMQRRFCINMIPSIFIYQHLFDISIWILLRTYYDALEDTITYTLSEIQTLTYLWFCFSSSAIFSFCVSTLELFSYNSFFNLSFSWK